MQIEDTTITKTKEYLRNSIAQMKEALYLLENSTETIQTDSDCYFRSEIKKGYSFFHSQKATIVCDWLEVFGEITDKNLLTDKFLFETPDNFLTSKNIVTENGITYTYNGKSTARYKKLLYVSHLGREIGMLQMQPKVLLDSMTVRSASFKLSNNIFYTENWVSYLREVMEAMDFKLNNITRIDIAIDGCNHINRFLNFYFKEDPSENIAELKWMGKSTLDASYMDRETRNYKTFNVGKRNSERSLIVYNKTVQIEKDSKKEYIKEFWKKNGLSLEHDNYRIEVRLDSRYMKSLDEFYFENLESDVYLKYLFYTATRNFFEFRLVNKTDKNIKRWKEIEPVAYHLLTGNLERLERHALPINDKLFQVRISIKSDIRELMTGKYNKSQRDAFFEVIKMRVTTNMLIIWFEKHLPMWLIEFKKFEITGHYYSINETEMTEPAETREVSQKEAEILLNKLYNEVMNTQTYQQVVAKEILDFTNNSIYTPVAEIADIED